MSQELEKEKVRKMAAKYERPAEQEPGFELLSNQEKEYYKIMRALGGVLYIQSEPGLAKSSIIRAIATKLGFQYFDIRLSMVDETDVGLFPHLIDFTFDNGNVGKVLSHCPPEWAVRSNEKKTIIHFEELNRASLAVRNAALQILLEREIGINFKFNRNVLMASSGNLGDEDNTDVEEFDAALKNRLVPRRHKLTPEDWAEQFANDNVTPIIVDFLLARPENFHKPPTNANGKVADSFATPRSWTFLSNYLLSTLGEEVLDLQKVEREAMLVAHSYVGPSSQAFIQYVRETNSLNIDDVLRDFDGCKARLNAASRDKRSDLLHSLHKKNISKLSNKEALNLVEFLHIVQEDEMVGYVTTMVDNITEDEIKNNPTYKMVFKVFSPIITKMTRMVK